MREIKFRAWDKHNKEMHQNWSTPFNDENDTNPFVFMQFTGLKDKGGKEIYEGDIVAAKFHPHYIERISWRGEPDAICKVIWDLSGFRLEARGKDDTRYCDFFDLSLKHSEIIGNIYENPELLRGR